MKIKETIIKELEENYKEIHKSIEYLCLQCKKTFIDVGKYEIKDGNEEFIDWIKKDPKNVKGLRFGPLNNVIADNESNYTIKGRLYAHNLDKCYAYLEAEQIQIKCNYRDQNSKSCGKCKHYEDRTSDFSDIGRCENPDYIIHFLVDADSICDNYNG